MKVLAIEEAKHLYRPFGGPRTATPQVGDDSIGWRICRATAAINRKMEAHWHAFNMRQVIQGSARHRPGTPPLHVRSIDFSSLVRFGHPSRETQEHFRQLIKIKAGVWIGRKNG